MLAATYRRRLARVATFAVTTGVSWTLTAGQALAGGAPKLTTGFNNSKLPSNVSAGFQNIIDVICPLGLGLAVIMIVGVGIRMAGSALRGHGVHEHAQGLGMVFAGAIVIASGAGLLYAVAGA